MRIFFSTFLNFKAFKQIADRLIKNFIHTFILQTHHGTRI
jgi:hypothetical protein